MENGMRFQVKVLLAVGIVLAASSLLYRKSVESSPYYELDCGIYDSRFRLMFKNGHFNFCDFAKDGSYLASNLADEIFTYYDKSDKIIWSASEIIHHQVKFSSDENSFLAISAEFIKFNFQLVKSDCFSRRDLNNRILYKWCLGDHLQEMKELGFVIRPRNIDYLPALHDKRVKAELSHANSIYEIDTNARGLDNAAFAKGNYLVNIFLPTFAVVILDSEMKKILWSTDLSKFPYGGEQILLPTHDLQVTPDGNILVYANNIKDLSHEWSDNQLNPNLGIFHKGPDHAASYSALLEFDPITLKVLWQYTRNHFFSPVLGSVTRMKNGNYLYSALDPSVHEVTPEGKAVRDFTARNGFDAARSVKPMYDDSFLRARGID